MISPIGNITNFSPVFQWEKVPGVPYYLLVLSDKEVVILEDPVTGEFELEGANFIWANLTSANSVVYGTMDPSGNFTSIPPPLAPGTHYYWFVLNCYGNTPELISTVQSGLSFFYVDIPPPGIDAPGPDRDPGQGSRRPDRCGPPIGDSDTTHLDAG